MPGYIKHLEIGTIIFIITIAYFGIPSILFIITLFPLFLIYSLLPDVDIPSSKIRKVTEICILLTTIILLLAFKKTEISIILLLLLLIFWFSKHRGIFHTIPAGIVLSLPIAMYNINMGIFCLLAYIIHLIADKFFKN